MELFFLIAAWVTIATLVVQLGFPRAMRVLGNFIVLSVIPIATAMFFVVGGSLVWWLLIALVLLVGVANVANYVFEPDTDPYFAKTFCDAA